LFLVAGHKKSATSNQLQATDKLIKQKRRIHRPRRGFGMELHAHERLTAVANVFVSIEGPRLPIRQQRFFVDSL
jgi:hypothetical protein